MGRNVGQAFKVGSVLIVITFLMVGLAAAQQEQTTPPGETGGKDVFTDADEAARQSANPLGGDFIIILNQWNYDFLQGDITSETRNTVTHIFQPVIPISLGGDWIWVTRPTLPIIYNAELPSLRVPLGFGGLTPPPPPPGVVDLDDFFDFKEEEGIGDLVVFSLVGVSKSTEIWGGGDIVIAGGATSSFPIASDEFATDQYQIGPAGVAAFIGKKYIFGALAQHWYDFEDNGNPDAADISLTNIQYFYFLNFPGGWQVGGAPQIEIDWKASGKDCCSIPIGLGVQKTHFFGPMPVRLGLEVQHYVEFPDTFGKEWRIQATFAPIIPNVIGNLIKGRPAFYMPGKK